MLFLGVSSGWKLTATAVFQVDSLSESQHFSLFIGSKNVSIYHFEEKILLSNCFGYKTEIVQPFFAKNSTDKNSHLRNRERVDLAGYSQDDSCSYRPQHFARTK